MKQLDTYNAKAREKAKDQPYSKKVVEFERACPYCDTSLIRDPDDAFAYLCSCGKWSSVYWKEKLEYQHKPKETE